MQNNSAVQEKYPDISFLTEETQTLIRTIRLLLVELQPQPAITVEPDTAVSIQKSRNVFVTQSRHLRFPRVRMWDTLYAHSLPVV